jgi:hypothetical protein
LCGRLKRCEPPTFKARRAKARPPFLQAPMRRLASIEVLAAPLAAPSSVHWQIIRF